MSPTTKKTEKRFTKDGVFGLKPNETARFVFTNSKKPDLLLTKTSSDGTPLEGVSFHLAKTEDGSHYLDRITDSKGGIFPTRLSIPNTIEGLR